MLMNFNGKVALITGSGRGIGRAIAEAFAGQGATVALSDFNLEALTAVSQEFEQKGYPFAAFPCNVTNATEVQALCDAVISRFGKIDILINNAGITRDTLLMRMKDEQWDAVLGTNLKGAFLVTRAAIKYFLRQKSGRIINIGSVVGLMGNIGQANYAASKAGLMGFSKSVARELAPRNITVNVIAPGFIETPMTAALPAEVRTAFMQKIPLNRAGTPQDVAGVALFLASPLADYITGQVIAVDGGMIM